MTRHSAIAIARPSIFLLGMLTAIDAMSIDSYLPALPGIARDFGTTPAQVQITFAVFLFGVAAGQAIWGPISDRAGRRVPLLGGLVLYAVSSLAAASSTTLDMLTIARLGQALGASAGLVLARAIISDLWEQDEASRLYSIMMQVLGVTAIVSPLVGGTLLAVSAWRSIFVVMVVLGGGTLAWVALRLPESLPPSARRAADVAGAGYGRLLHAPAFLLATGCCALATSAMFATLAGMPFLFVDTFGWSTTAFSVLYGTSSIAFIAVCEVNQRLLGRFGDRRLLAFGLAMQVVLALGMAGLAAAGLATPGVFAVLWTLLMANLGFTLGNATSLAMGLAPEGASGTASGALGVTQFALSAAVAPLTVAGANVALTLSATTALCALLAAGMAFAALRLRPGSALRPR